MSKKSWKSRVVHAFTDPVVSLLKAAGKLTGSSGAERFNYFALWPDLITHEYVVSHWMRQESIEVPVELRRLTLQFSANSAQGGRLMRFLGTDSLVPMIRVTLKYKWYGALDTIARWATLKAENKKAFTGDIVPAFCEAFADVSEEQFVSLIQRDSFTLSETMIFHIAVSWLKTTISDLIEDEEFADDTINVGSFVEGVIKHIRWYQLPLSFLMSDVYESGMLTDDELLAMTKAKVLRRPKDLETLGFKSTKRQETGDFSWQSLVGTHVDMTQDLAEYLDFLDQVTVGELVKCDFRGSWQNGKILEYDMESDCFRVVKDPTHGDEHIITNRYARQIVPRISPFGYGRVPPQIPPKYLPA